MECTEQPDPIVYPDATTMAKSLGLATNRHYEPHKVMVTSIPPLPEGGATREDLESAPAAWHFPLHYIFDNLFSSLYLHNL